MSDTPNPSGVERGSKENRDCLEAKSLRGMTVPVWCGRLDTGLECSPMYSVATGRALCNTRVTSFR